MLTCWKEIPLSFLPLKLLLSRVAPRVAVLREPLSCVEAAPSMILKSPE